MPQSKKLCCFSWAIWTTIIGYFEAITGMVGVILLTLIIIAYMTLKEEIVIPNDDGLNATYVLNLSSAAVGVAPIGFTETEFRLEITYLVIDLIFQVTYVVLATYLIIGVAKKNIKHVMLWIVIKTSLLLVGIFALMGQHILTCFGYEMDDVDLWKKAVFLGIDAICIYIVFNYYQIERDAMDAYDPNMHFVRIPKFKGFY